MYKCAVTHDQTRMMPEDPEVSIDTKDEPTDLSKTFVKFSANFDDGLSSADYKNSQSVANRTVLVGVIDINNLLPHATKQ